MPMACARRVYQSDREPPGCCGLHRGPVPRTVIGNTDREGLAALPNHSTWRVQEPALARARLVADWQKSGRTRAMGEAAANWPTSLVDQGNSRAAHASNHTFEHCLFVLLEPLLRRLRKNVPERSFLIGNKLDHLCDHIVRIQPSFRLG
jgi:hypothetical protein